MLCLPDNIEAIIFSQCSDGDTAELPWCQSFVYLDGLVPDFRRRRLAWAVSRSVRAILQPVALLDRQRAAMFQAVVETVLLYNAGTWTLTEVLEY